MLRHGEKLELALAREMPQGQVDHERRGQALHIDRVDEGIGHGDLEQRGAVGE
ncbi:hypothetical protein D3C87_2003240 [compost metagenome]